MDEFLRVALNLPTLAYSISMGLMLVYWLTVVVGLIDLDMFDVDIDLDMDIDLEADAEVGGIGGLAGVLSGLGLVGVPLTVSLSFLVFYNWALTFLASYFLGGHQAALGVGMGVLVFLGCFVLSIPMTSLTIRPLRPLFYSAEGARAADALVGQSVRVLSGRVNAQAGRAEVILDGQPVQLSVRCDTKENTLKKGAEALIIGYDEARHTYLVEPMDEMKSHKPVRQQRLEAEFDKLGIAPAQGHEEEEELAESEVVAEA